MSDLSKMRVGNKTYNLKDKVARISYAHCQTVASTSAKTATVINNPDGLTLEAGTRICVKFETKNTANNPTLNIGNTGAKNIFYKGEQLTTDTSIEMLVGFCDFIYDGTQWHLIGSERAYTREEAYGRFLYLRGYNVNIESWATSENHYDLNDLTDVGAYATVNNTNTAYFENRPNSSAQSAFIITVTQTRALPGYLRQRLQYSSSYAAYERISVDEGTTWSEWHRIQDDSTLWASESDMQTIQSYFTNGVANEAIKLNATKTLWGQSFDGSDNVSGNMSNVGNILPESNITSELGSSSKNFKTVYTPIIDTKSGYRLRLCSGGTEMISATSSKVGVGTTSPSYKLHVDGDVGATAFTNTSDERLKDKIKDVDLSIKDIANAPVFQYKWNQENMDKELHVGSSAQYWKKVLPEVVNEANDKQKTLSMQYGVAGLVSSVVIAKEVEHLVDKIKKLEERIEQLEALKK